MEKEMQRYLILDFETRSEADLRKLGAVEYAKHPSTEILCVAWQLGTREELKDKKSAHVWSPFIPSPYGELVKSLCDPGVMLVAHNALFEQSITRHTLSRIIHRPELKAIPPERWICTASLAASLALPRNLEGACLALGLSVQKDMLGHRLILKYCKPRKPTKENKNKWHNDLNDLKRLMKYCATDVDAETELFLRARPLNPTERKVWELDQKINQRGFTIDRDLVETTLSMIDTEITELDRETKNITGGMIQSTNQRAAVLRYVNDAHIEIPDLRGKTVSDYLKSNEPKGDGFQRGAHRLLEIRQATSKTSTAKYIAFKTRAGSDLRVRDNLVYHAASTGRWGGAGVQVQNLYRPTMKVTDDTIDAIKSGDLEWVRFLYTNPMNVFASCLRSVIVASPGKELFCADYAAIEARMLFWFANHQSGINAFVEGRDLYKEMAAYVYNKPLDQVTSLERFIGKTLVLGAGYGLGAKKFKFYCEQQGIILTDEEAERAIKAYRTKHEPVTQLWSNIERAAIMAVRNPGKKYTINKTSWFVSDNFLWCQLPSGRRLAYYRPEMKVKKTPWGQDKAMLHHWGINPVSKKWELGSTWAGTLVENIDQATSRDLMAEAMLRIENAGYEIILSVHDELLAERKRGEGSVEEFTRLMTELPEWAKGSPVKAEGWSGSRYRK